MPKELVRLLCGETPSTSEYASIFQHIGATLDDLLAHYKRLLDRNDEVEIGLFGPFVGRSILELCASALVGRFDPFRILVLREMQLQPDYDVGERNKAAIQWAGDVVAEKVSTLWKADRAVASMSRALLGDYYDTIFWQRAFTRLLDSTADDRGGDWMAMLKRLKPEQFIPSFRTRFDTTFSSCSKGIHHELVIPRETFYDLATVKTLVGTAIMGASCLGLTANSIDHIPFALSKEDALACFEAIQEWEVSRDA